MTEEEYGLSIQYLCPKCNEIGYIHSDFPLSFPMTVEGTHGCGFTFKVVSKGT